MNGHAKDGGERPPEPKGSRASTRGRVTSWIAGFLAVIMLAEGGTRLLSGQLSDPVDYINLQAQTFVRDMNVLHAHHIRSDLTFVGNSMVQRGISTNTFKRELPGAAWVNNVAIGGFEAPVLKRWVLEEVVPRLQPRRVVIGVSSSDFNAGRAVSTQSIVRYDAARATKPGVYGALDRLVERSALSEYREDLRDPYQLLEAAQGRVTQMPPGGSLQTRATWKLGYKKLTAAQLASGRRAELQYICTQQLRDFRVGPDEMRAFGDTVHALRAQGIQVVVVLMPVSSQYINCHPRRDADEAAWAADVAAAGAEQHVTVVDLSHSMPDGDFRDYEHLNVRPAEQFSSMLAARLRDLGW